MDVLIVMSQDDVKSFVRERYIESRNGTLAGVNLMQSKRHTVTLFAIIEEQRFNVQIDYVFGDFLIDGLPMGRLPTTITTTEIFQRVFGSTTFEVQPRNRVFSTVQKYRGFWYIFREHEDDGVIVRERNDDASQCTKQLIPHIVFNDIVPYQLMESFSHWYNEDRNTIEFRPKMFSDANFGTNEGIQYELDLTTRRLKHLKTQRVLLYVRSFEKIVGLLKRLEHENYINVMMDKPLRARVELVRMNLNFIIDCSSRKVDYHIDSNEYSGMRVSLQQNIGTLFGLRFGLVLESIDASVTNRLVIVPHAHFNVGRLDHHVKVEIAAKSEELRSPSFFVYRVNNECRTLNANSFAAWFYLAHLHAVTSYPLPDPFSGMTGVERALQILQSGFAWSSSPYDKESYRTLMALADISPIRRFQAKQPNDASTNRIAQPQWPAGLRHHAAQDAFVIIVRQLMAASMRLASLYTPNEKKPPPKAHSMIELNARSHARHVVYTPNCNVSESFMKCENRVSHFVPEKTKSAKNMKHVRELAAHFNAAQRGLHVPSGNVAELIFDMFTAERTLNGLTGQTGKVEEQKPITSVMDLCLSSAFPDLWLNLYERIRKSATLNAAEQEREVNVSTCYSHCWRWKVWT